MHDAAASINWWHLGPAYQHDPALGWYILTFVIFVAALVYMVRKPLLNFIEARAKAIGDAIEEGKIAKEESQKRLKSYSDRLGEIDAEVEKMVMEFKKQGERERILLEETARQMALQIRKETQDTIEAEKRRARTILMQGFIHEAMGLAKKELQKGLSETHQKNLREDFIYTVSHVPH